MPRFLEFCILTTELDFDAQAHCPELNRILHSQLMSAKKSKSKMSDLIRRSKIQNVGQLLLLWLWEKRAQKVLWEKRIFRSQHTHPVLNCHTGIWPWLKRKSEMNLWVRNAQLRAASLAAAVLQQRHPKVSSSFPFLSRAKMHHWKLKTPLAPK